MNCERNANWNNTKISLFCPPYWGERWCYTCWQEYEETSLCFLQLGVLIGKTFWSATWQYMFKFKYCPSFESAVLSLWTYHALILTQVQTHVQQYLLRVLSSTSRIRQAFLEITVPLLSRYVSLGKLHRISRCHCSHLQDYFEN